MNITAQEGMMILINKSLKKKKKNLTATLTGLSK
jgi:hypothetical protein